MASDFLKKKAQEQAESVTKRFGEDAYGGTKWRESQQETNGKEGGNKPSSTQSNRYESTRASSFLSKKAEEQAASITERFGEDAYGGTKWRSENSALSSDALSQLLQQVQGLGTPGATADTKRTSGGYYSRPVAPEGVEDIYNAVSYLTPALREAAIPATVAQEGLQAAEADLQIVSDYLQRAMEAYNKNPTVDNANTYNQIVAKYDEIYKGYAAAYDAYNAAYNKYKSTEDQAVQILNAYQSYSAAQQAAYDDWRGTIRDAASVEASIVDIAAQLKASEQQDQQAVVQAYAQQQTNKPWWQNALEGAYNGAYGIDPSYQQSAQLQQALKSAGDSDRTAALRAELELLKDELGWSKYFFYDDYRSGANFDSLSRYVPQERQERRAIDIMLDNYSNDASGWEDPLYEAVNGNPEAVGYLSNAGADYYGSDNALGAIYGRVTEDKSEADQMTEDEVAMFNYLYATQGPGAAHEYYYNYLRTSLFSRERAESEAYWRRQARENPVGSSIFSVAVSPMKGLTYLGQATDFLTDGELTEDAPYNSFSYIPGTIRETVPENWGAVGTFAYQTGMSMADFLLTTAITGGNLSAALTIMGSGAAADTTLAAKDRGLEDWQAFTLGTVAGLAEVLTEKVSLDKLFDADLLADGTLKYILGNAFAEGSEEVASSTINLLADIIVSKDQSEWQQSINAYMEEGLTEGQAFARAMADQALSLGADFLGGFISGGAMGGGGAVIGSINTEKIGNELGNLQMNDEDIQSFIETGLESDPETASYKIAVELQGKIQKGQKLSNYDLSRLYQANVQAQPEAGWDSSTAPKNVSLPRLDDESGDEVSAEAMRRQAQTDYRAGKITEAEFDAIIDEVMHLEELEDGTSVKTFDSQTDVNAQTDNININVNGGTTYDNIQQQPGRPAAAQSTGGFDTQRADISDGVPIRDAGQGAGIQTGQMASGTGRQGTQTNSQAKAIVERQNTAGDLRQQGLISATSSLALGIESGTDTENLYVMPQEYYDAELLQAAQFARAETGLNVAFTVGNIEINRGSRTGKVRGVHTGQQIVVQSDNAKATAMQLVKHEVFHDKVMKDPGLTQRLKEEVRDRFTPQEFDAVIDRYIDELWPLYGPADETAWDEYESAWNIILEEMLADAYAGINAFGAHAEQFTETVSELTPAKTVDKQQKQDNGTEEPTGPPSDRYSYAGENANNADLDALARAKEMQAAGVADETIRQQTGWHTGMDGKWRWEIDDSKMQYTSRGDLGLRERRPDYARYRELLDKSNRYALELSDEALTPEETAELQKLKDIWGGTFRKAGRITEDALPTDLLSDYVKHDDLFEAYPQLRKTRLRFADLPEGTRGQYDPERDVITLSESLRGKPQDTLIHEIQHVIQKAEGFSRGSSVEYWAAKLTDDRRREVELADKKYREIFNSMPEELKNKVRAYNRANLDYDYDEAIAIENELLESEYGELFSAWQDADFERRNLRERYKAADLTEDAITNYRNTAGEIEARDAASRRQLTAEQRRSAEPARADDRTVFVEDVDDLGLQLGEMYSVDDTDSPVTIGDLQAELYQLQSQRRSILEADADYASAAENLRYANTFTEKVAARKAMAAAAANIDTTDIDQRITELNDQISEIRNRETRQHREDQEKYSGTKTAGYSTMPDTRLKDLDQDYMKAVRSGDRARMAELVEQAAEAAMPASVVRDKSGRLLKTYHHTGSRFTVFDRNMARTGTEMDGFFFAPDPDSTSEYGSNMITAYLNITKLAMDPKLDRKFNDSGTLLREKLAYQGYDGMARTENGEIYEYMTFDPEQIKSADPVVYDDRGRVVPLSERFNFRNPDIRYSVDDGGQDPAQLQAAAEFDQDTISGNIRQVAQMEPVTSISGHEFAKGEVDLITQVETFFNQRGNRAYSPELGEVILDRRGIKSDIAHGIGRKKAAAFAAVPDAIEHGLVVDYQKDWKGRGYDTAVVAAPITIGTEDHIAAVILTRSNQTNRFYVHEVLTTKNGAMPFKTGAQKEGAPGGDAPSVFSILDKIRSVKNGSEFQEKFSANDMDASGTNELRENMTTKEREILRGVETRLLRNIGGALSVTKFGDRSYLKSVIRGLSDTYLEYGTIEQQAMDDLFEQAYRQGIVVDRELHDQYEEVRKYLHTVSLTLDPRDRSDIADYPDFVKRMRGRMRIVNEGGLPVDSAWHELNDMAPELFPDSIAHPADQLVRMAEVLDSLRIAEKSLSDYYGPMASTYKKDAKAEFERAVWESIGELRQIRRFEQERQQKLQEAEPAPTTPEEAMEAWAKLKTARKTYEKAMAKNLLTTEDEIAVGELLKGKMLPEHLDKDNLNVKGILAVYEAKQEYEHLTKLLAEYRRKVKADIRAEADAYLETANTWKDKDIGLLYSREIMQRNVEDIVPDKKLAKRINERYFEPVRDAEAAAVKMKEEYREAVRKLNLSRNVKKGNLVSEAHAVQLYGEAMDNIRILEKARGRLKHRDGKSLEEWRGVVYKLWQENPGLDKAKIESAVTEMRQIYDELFRKMNEVRVRWGYEPVNYRQGYFPHFQPGDGDGIMAQFGRVLGIDTQVVALPTTINGLTHTFKPGIQWFGNAQERLGFNTAYDAVEGFDRYIEGVASVICQTENIQRLRALASQIRYRTSDEGIRKQVDAIYSNAALTEEQKNDAISGIYEKGRYTLSNFVVEVDEYTNLLANKKSKLDRTVEALIGRKFYTAMKWLESRVGANMIAGNVTSALTNFIPLTQASAQLSKKAMLKGMWDTLASYKTDDGIIDRSAFLTNRRGSDPLVKVWSTKVSEVLGKPMELIDSFTSGSIVRAAYYQNLKQGLSESEAMHQADIFASRVMAERSKGGMPTLFESKNPFFKLFTQFQLEVNNQWSEVFKDIPRSQREKGLGALALVFLQYFLGAWLFNNLYEKWIGRRPAMDPIDIVLDTVKDFASDDVSATDALGNLANNVLEELPFSSALTLVGIETDGGRVPVSSGIPNIPTLVNAATNEDWAPEKRWKEAQDELNKLAYVIPPFGGNQVSKIWKGIKAYIEGGSYSVDSDGNDILQYPVYNDESGDFWGLVQAMLLGKSALPEAKEWVEDGFDSLSAKQTAIYQDMIDSGVSEREAYDLIDSLRSASETEDASKKEAQIDILQNAEASDECKAIAFYGLLATDNERLLMDSLTDSGAMPGPVMDVLIQLRDAADLPSAEEKAAQADILIGSALTESEKENVIRSWLDDQEVNENGNLTSLGKFNLAMKQGITTEEYLQFRATGMEIDKLLEYTEAGFEADEAQDLAQAIHDLDPLPGEDRVSALQKWRASVDFSDDVEDQLTALSMIMEPKSLAVWETANNYGVAPDVYVTFQEIATQYDTNGNGSYTQAEAKAAIDAEFSNLTTTQKAVLWQWVCYSSGSKKNPYDPTVGQNFIDSRDAAKAAAEE